MDLNVLQSKSSSCTDLSSEDEPTTSTEYHTITDDEEMSSITSYDTVSVDSNIDLDSTDQSSFLSGSASCEEINNRNSSEHPPGKLEYECKICVRQYRTLQECLRHELLEHNNGQKSPQKSVRTTLSHLLPAFEKTNQQADRQRIHELFRNSKPGLELCELLQIYCISDEKVKHIIMNVTSCLRKDLCLIQNAVIETFGSCENGLMMWDSDIDMYVTVRNPTQRFKRRIYNHINQQLRRGQFFDEIVAIRRARVPIIKCRHLATGMRIDINCSCPNSVVNTRFLRELLNFDERLRLFMRFMKVWGKHMWIVGRNRMTSYCLCILVLFYLQQPRDSEPAFVPSIQKLQSDAPANYVNGVNYAFELYQHMRPLPADLPTSQLIRGFFQFYRNFDFFTQMVAPYLGVTVSLKNFQNKNYKYTAYLRQLNSMKAAASWNEDIEELNTERAMVVQDPFQLNQNVSRGIVTTQLEYFRKCIEYGYHICIDTNVQSDGQLYEALLFDVIRNMENEARQLRICTGHNATMVQPHEMTYTFSPCRAEIRALTAQQLSVGLANGAKMGNLNSTYHLWVRHYIEAIYVILTQVYDFSIKLLTENDDPYDEQLLQYNSNHRIDPDYYRQHVIDSYKQFDEKNEVVWIIIGTIDTWSDRIFQRESSQTFMSIQCAQTQKFLHERENNKAYAVELLGRFVLKSIENSRMIEILLKQHQQTRQWFHKKDPMRRFFTNFKCSLQNFNLKEKLHEESGRRYGILNKANETFSWQAIACEVISKTQPTIKEEKVE